MLICYTDTCMISADFISEKTRTDISETLAWLETYHIVSIVVILVVAYIVREFGTRLLMKIIAQTIRHDQYPSAADRKKRIKTLQSLVRAVLHAAVWILAILLIIGEFKPELATALIAGSSVVGVALGFGAKGVVADFLAGIFIIYENQYRVGDVIELNRTGITGTVEAITIRTTVLRDNDGNVHHIPNGTINFTTNKTMDYSYINMNLTLSFDTNFDTLTKVVNKIGDSLANDPAYAKKILEAPHLGPVSNFDPSGMIVTVQGKVVASKQWDVTAELRRRIIVEFRKHGLGMPFQKDLPVSETETLPPTSKSHKAAKQATK